MIKKVIRYLWIGNTIIRVEDLEEVKDEYTEKVNKDNRVNKDRFQRKMYLYIRRIKNKVKKIWQKINRYLP